jgi:hypothetical protein
MVVHLLVLACLGLLDPALTPEVRAEYRRRAAAAGTDPEANVRLALWCEARGMTAERRGHLEAAVAAAPDNALARALLGQVEVQGRWQRPDEVGDRAREAAALAEYNTRRGQMAETAEAHWKMALWCEQNGLAAEARAHLAVVVQLDPRRDAAWKRLGCRLHHGRWLSETQIAQEKAAHEQQEQANRHWRPLLERYRAALDHKERNEHARRALAEIHDPLAVPMVWQVFARGGARQQAVAVQVLGQIDTPASSKALAILATCGDTPEVRTRATEALKKRDPREYAGMLIAQLRAPVKYEVRPVRGPGAPGAVFVRGERFNVLSLYAPQPLPFVPVYPGDRMAFDDSGMPVLLRRPETITIAQTGRITADRIMAQINAADQQGQAEQAAIQRLAQAAATHNAQATQQAAARVLMSGPSTATTGGFNRGSLLSYSQPAAHTLGQTIMSTHKKGNLPLDSFGFGLTASVTNQTQIPIGQMILQAQWEAMSAEAQLESEVAAIESFNTMVGRRNEQFARVLADATGQDLGPDREAWKAWWIDQLGYAYRPKEKPASPTVVMNVPLEYQAPPVMPVTVSSGPQLGFQRMSCFGAGTPVLTYGGARAIETLRIGDLVLTENIKNGALSYQPNLVVYHNPPSKTFEIDLGGETIVSSYFYRFWKG